MTLEDIKSSWRPVFSWVFIIFYAALGASIVYLLLMGVGVAELSNIAVVMIGAGGGVTGVYMHGRSREKLNRRDKEYPDELEGENAEFN